MLRAMQVSVSVFPCVCHALCNYASLTEEEAKEMSQVVENAAAAAPIAAAAVTAYSHALTLDNTCKLSQPGGPGRKQCWEAIREFIAGTRMSTRAVSVRLAQLWPQVPLPRLRSQPAWPDGAQELPGDPIDIAAPAAAPRHGPMEPWLHACAQVMGTAVAAGGQIAPAWAEVLAEAEQCRKDPGGPASAAPVLRLAELLQRLARVLQPAGAREGARMPHPLATAETLRGVARARMAPKFAARVHADALAPVANAAFGGMLQEEVMTAPLATAAARSALASAIKLLRLLSGI
jgi:hypothetical protein